MSSTPPLWRCCCRPPTCQSAQGGRPVPPSAEPSGRFPPVWKQRKSRIRRTYKARKEKSTHSQMSIQFESLITWTNWFQYAEETQIKHRQYAYIQPHNVTKYERESHLIYIYWDDRFNSMQITFLCVNFVYSELLFDPNIFSHTYPHTQPPTDPHTHTHTHTHTHLFKTHLPIWGTTRSNSNPFSTVLIFSPEEKQLPLNRLNNTHSPAHRFVSLSIFLPI